MDAGFGKSYKRLRGALPQEGSAPGQPMAAREAGCHSTCWFEGQDFKLLTKVLRREITDPVAAAAGLAWPSRTCLKLSFLLTQCFQNSNIPHAFILKMFKNIYLSWHGGSHL
jgi:hypothetical protein